jgi:hypothetical protein
VYQKNAMVCILVQAASKKCCEEIELHRSAALPRGNGFSATRLLQTLNLTAAQQAQLSTTTPSAWHFFDACDA